MLDREEMSQVTYRVLDLMAAARQRHNGSYRYLVEVRGIVMYSHHPIGLVLRDFG